MSSRSRFRPQPKAPHPPNTVVIRSFLQAEAAPGLDIDEYQITVAAWHRSFTPTLTDFLRDPNRVIDELEQTDVVLHRRNAGDLRLSLQARGEEGDEGLRFIARFLGAAFADDDVRERLVAAAMVVPWVTMLPPADRRTFTDELFLSAEAAGELGSIAPVARLLVRWKAIAAGYAEAPSSSRQGRAAPTARGRRPAAPGA